MTDNLRSRFSDLQISESNWVISLLKVRQGNHAQMALEGKLDGNFFAKFAHFTGPQSHKDSGGSYFGLSNKGVVKTFRDIGSQFEWGNAVSWLIPSEKGQALMRRVDGSSTGKNRFNILGRFSLFNRRGWKTTTHSLLGAGVGGGVWGGLMFLIPGVGPVLGGGIALYCAISAGVTGGLIGHGNFKEANNCVTWAIAQIQSAGVEIKLPLKKILVSHTNEIIEDNKN